MELTHHVETSHAKFIIGEPSLLSVVRKTASQCNILDAKIFVFDAVDSAPYSDLQPWTSLLSYGEANWLQFTDPEVQKDSIATLAFTSGTTGLPKGAMIPHAYHVSQIWAMRSRGKPYKVSRLLCLPPFHTFGMPLISGCALREGHTIYLMRKFEVKHFVECVSRCAVTETAVVPAMIVAINTYISQVSAQKEGKEMDSLRYVWSAGSPLRHSTQADFQALLSPDAKMVQVWGMTELGWATALFWPEGDETGSVGRPMPGMSIKYVLSTPCSQGPYLRLPLICPNPRLIDDQGYTIDKDDTEGEILVKSPNMMRGYLDNPTATSAAVDADGYLRSGDVGYKRQGKWYVVDRKKDLLKVRGWQVSPAELEAVLLTHPDVAGAAVIGVMGSNDHDLIRGEVPRAYVVCIPSSKVQEQGLKDFVAARLARYKHLEGGVRFIDEIPRNASGKILRPKLRMLDAEREGHGEYNPVRETAMANVEDIRRKAQEGGAVVNTTQKSALTSVERIVSTSAITPDHIDSTPCPNSNDKPPAKRLHKAAFPNEKTKSNGPSIAGDDVATKQSTTPTSTLAAFAIGFGLVITGMCWFR